MTSDSRATTILTASLSGSSSRSFSRQPQRRTSRASLTARSTQRETLPPAILRCHFAWAVGSNRFRGFGRSSMRTSFATGLASRVMTISFSICKRASVSGHR